MLKRKILITYLSFVICHLIFPASASAQAGGLSLSLTPPLTEIVSKPGRSSEARYIIRNGGVPVYIEVNLAPFTAFDAYGNASPGENLSEFDPQSFSSWFTFTKPKMKYGGKFLLPQGEAREVILKITPSEDAKEGDYYFTITFESGYGDKPVVGNSILKTKIGSNILLTVSENETPAKKGKLTTFRAPKILDSMIPIAYEVEIANTGNVLFKPSGRIIITDLLGHIQVLNLAPLNVLASSRRIINCIDGDEIIPCSIKNRFPFGLYRAKLIFNLDGEEKMFSDETLTLVLPTSFLIITILIIILILRLRSSLKKNS